MSIGYFEASACLGKKAFTSLRDAQIEAKGISSRGRRSHAYKCPFCDGYHIGKSDEKDKKMVTNRKKGAKRWT